MYNGNKSYRKFRPAKALFFVVMAVLFVGVLGSVVMVLWNAILPDVLGAKPLKFWQAIGLFVLARILFGGFGGKRWGNRHQSERRKKWKEKWMGMSQEERSEFKGRWKNYCNQRGMKKDSEPPSSGEKI